jgi:hypothetical protein
MSESRHNLVYAYHFNLLMHLHYRQYIIIPYFLLHYTKRMVAEVQIGKIDAFAHQGIIILLVIDSLSSKFLGVTWNQFMGVWKINSYRC